MMEKRMYKNKRMEEGRITGEFIKVGNISDEYHISVGSIPAYQLHVEYQNMSEIEDGVVDKGDYYGETTE